MNAPTCTTIAVCVASYKRPALLAQCLKAIAKLELPEKTTLIVLVVDNDEEESGRSTIEELNAFSTRKVVYHVERTRGIASARNRLLKEALNNEAELIAFIDDDEFPDPAWLKNHLRMLSAKQADVSTGPVVALTESGEFISSTQGKYDTGHRPRRVSTNNVLFKSKLIKSDRLLFDLRLNFCGGEDFDFFEKSSAKGNKHVWTEDAIVFETIENKRTTKKYLFYRHFTGGINNVIQYKFTKGSFSTWLHFSLKIIGKAIGAIVTFAAGLITLNKLKLDKSIVKLASVVGYIAGLLNIKIERYR